MFLFLSFFLNVHNDLSACFAHEGKKGTNEFARVLIRENFQKKKGKKKFLHLPRPEWNPTVAAFIPLSLSLSLSFLLSLSF